MTDSRYRSRYATKAWKMVCGCIAHGRAEDHMCPKKAEILTSRKCAYEPCTTKFTPRQASHRFCKKSCATKDSVSRNAPPGVEKKPMRAGLTEEELHALEMAPTVLALEEATRLAELHVPVMGDALYEATMLCMRGESHGDRCAT